MSKTSEGPSSNANTNTSGTTAGTLTGTNSSISGSGSQTQQGLPDWFLTEWQNLIDQGKALNSSGQSTVAGLMPDQEAASWLTNSLLQDYMNKQRIPAYDVFGMGTGWDKGVIPVSTATAASALGTPTASAQQAQAASAEAAQLAPGAIAPFMNPFIDTALNPTLRRLAGQQGEVQAGIGANAAASGMFGGSREAVARSLADRNYRDTAANTTGNMLNQGWNTAAGLAGANVDRSQAVNLANAGFEQAANQLNAQLGTSTSVANMQAATQAGMANAALANQVALANAAAENQAQLAYQNLSYQGSQADAERFLKAVQLEDAGTAQEFATSLAGIGLLNQLGTQQQATAQKSLDQYWKQLEQLASLLKIINPGMDTTALTASGSDQQLSQLTSGTNQSTGTTTTTSQKPIDWASLLLGSLGVGSKLLSDRDDKTDIKKLGKDPDSGVDMYAYRYKGDPKSYPKVVGPMAQDLEEFLPGITKLIGGHRVISPR